MLSTKCFWSYTEKQQAAFSLITKVDVYLSNNLHPFFKLKSLTAELNARKGANIVFKSISGLTDTWIALDELHGTNWRLYWSTELNLKEI